jgi:hypothetical protein
MDRMGRPSPLCGSKLMVMTHLQYRDKYPIPPSLAIGQHPDPSHAMPTRMASVCHGPTIGCL